MSSWNNNSPQTYRISFLSGYLSDENVVKKYFKQQVDGMILPL